MYTYLYRYYFYVKKYNELEHGSPLTLLTPSNLAVSISFRSSFLARQIKRQLTVRRAVRASVDRHTPLCQMASLCSLCKLWSLLQPRVCCSLRFWHLRRCLSSFFRHLRYCVPRIRPSSQDRQSIVLLQGFAAFEGGRLVKSTGSVEREELDSSWRQCTISPSPKHSWISSQK